MSVVAAPPRGKRQDRWEFVLIRPKTFSESQRRTFIIDRKSGERVAARIRPVKHEDEDQLGEINSSYRPDPSGQVCAYVLVTDFGKGERIEGAVSLALSVHNNAKSLQVGGIDSAPWNMHSAEAREYSFVGSRLMEFAVETSMNSECEGRIHVNPRDAAARAFYEHLGFGGRGLVRNKDGTFYLPKKVAPEFIENIRKGIEG